MDVRPRQSIVLFIQEADLAHRTRCMLSNLSFLILRMNEPVNEFRVRSVYLFFLRPALVPRRMWVAAEKSM